MAGEKNFNIKNGLSVGGVEVIDSNGDIVAAGVGTAVNEAIADKIGGIISATGGATATYNDSADTIVIDVPITDEDNMASNSATAIPSQQSVKAYVDAQVDTADALSELSGDSDDITEGSTNLFFTNARADARIAASSIAALSDVGSLGSPSAGQILAFDGSGNFTPSAGITTINVGTGYTPLVGKASYTGVELTSISGSGLYATANISIENGVATASTIAIGGTGYVVGDVLGISTSNVIKGSDALISVTATNGKSTLYLKNVQGEEFTTGQPLVVTNGSSQISLASTTITSSAIYDSKYEGNVLEGSQFNHGMQADNNFVTLADVEPDTPTVLLTDALGINDQVISVASTSEFATYSGISTTQGYVKINSEIIYYNSIGVNQLGIGTRGIDGTIPRTHDTGDRSNKYELNGFDLRKINTNHDMALMPVAINNLKDIDTYYLSLDRGSLSSGDTQVSFIDEANLGGDNIFSSQKSSGCNSIQVSSFLFDIGLCLNSSTKVLSGLKSWILFPASCSKCNLSIPTFFVPYGISRVTEPSPTIGFLY